MQTYHPSHILSKSSCPYTHISPLPPPHFYRPTPNHLHSYAPHAQTTSIYHASPPQPHSEPSKDVQIHRLPKSSINRFQVVQNSLALTIYPSVKWSDHISPVLHKLHGLPVSSRIEFKIVTLTFKVLKFQQPAYINDLITPYIPPWSLRSSNKNFLIVPDIRSEMGRRSFSFLQLPILSLNISALLIH